MTGTAPAAPSTRADDLRRLRLAREAVYSSGFATGVRGKTIPAFPTGMTDSAGQFLRDLVAREGCRATLETGFALGLSASFILEGLLCSEPEDPGPPAVHTAIDPLASTHWDGAGTRMLAEAGLRDRLDLIEEDSALALPTLARASRRFDLMFVDGGHTFDAVFMDLFWAGRLVRPDGLIVLDDLWMPAVRTAAAFFEQNLGWQVAPPDSGPGKRFAVYRLPSNSSARDWDHFVPFWNQAVTPPGAAPAPAAAR